MPVWHLSLIAAFIGLRHDPEDRPRPPDKSTEWPSGGGPFSCAFTRIQMRSTKPIVDCRLLTFDLKSKINNRQSALDNPYSVPATCVPSGPDDIIHSTENQPAHCPIDFPLPSRLAPTQESAACRQHPPRATRRGDFLL